MLKIVPAESDELIRHTQMLSQEYVKWIIAAIGEHCPALEISSFIQEHDYGENGAEFPDEYVPPYGRLLVAMNDSEAAGCVALGKLSESVCEMRTLFVRPAFRRIGAGRQLAESTLHAAREIGYSTMCLDTLAFMDSALGLYMSLGFHDIEPYREVSGEIRHYIRFLEIALRT